MGQARSHTATGLHPRASDARSTQPPEDPAHHQAPREVLPAAKRLPPPTLLADLHELRPFSTRGQRPATDNRTQHGLSQPLSDGKRRRPTAPPATPARPHPYWRTAPPPTN